MNTIDYKTRIEKALDKTMASLAVINARAMSLETAQKTADEMNILKGRMEALTEIIKG